MSITSPDQRRPRPGGYTCRTTFEDDIGSVGGSVVDVAAFAEEACLGSDFSPIPDPCPISRAVAHELNPRNVFGGKTHV